MTGIRQALRQMTTIATALGLALLATNAFGVPIGQLGDSDLPAKLAALAHSPVLTVLAVVAIGLAGVLAAFTGDMKLVVAIFIGTGPIMFIRMFIPKPEALEVGQAAADAAAGGGTSPGVMSLIVGAATLLLLIVIFFIRAREEEEGNNTAPTARRSSVPAPEEIPPIGDLPAPSETEPVRMATAPPTVAAESPGEPPGEPPTSVRNKRKVVL